MIRVIGYGNPGRGDDGLGQALAGRIAAADLPGVAVDSDYQLTVDHALLVSQAAQVVFVDALIGGEAPYTFAEVQPSTKADLTSHSLGPATVLALSETLFGTVPKGFVLGITGQAFGEVKEGLSQAALDNLDLAEGFFRDWLRAATPLEARHA